MDKKDTKKQTSEQGTELQTCGIIMPISSIEDCKAEHWAEVKSIIEDAIRSAGLKPNLVSDADDSGVIQKRIVQNIYNNEIVVCDVSCKNPNVMFELGMRLAFDKPTIIIMDNKTGYSFDTSVIEHISYPRDLRYQAIIDFKEKLSDKIKATLIASQKEGYTTFLKHFGEFKVAQIEEKEGSINYVILDRLEQMSLQISRSKGKQELSSEETQNTTELINMLTREGIDEYCKTSEINEATIFLNNSDERNALHDYLSKNKKIRLACIKPSRLTKAIDDVLCPF